MELAVEFVVTDSMRDEWLEELEDLLPERLDQIDADGDLLIQHHYVPHSARLVGPLVGRNEELTPCVLECSFLVTQHQASDTTLSVPIQLSGVVEIPVGWDGQLITEEVDFISSLTGQ